MNSSKRSQLLYWGMTAAGLCCPVITKLTHFSAISGPAAFIWLFVYFSLSCRFRTKKERLITGASLVIGYCVFSAGVAGSFWVGLLPTAILGLLLYGAILLAAVISVRWNHFPVTLVLPGLWLCLYLIALALRVPVLVRLDILFADMTTLLQAERYIGPVGLCFAIVWLVSVFRFALANRKKRWAALGCAIYLLLLIPGVITLYPGVQAAETVRAAYTTGPYMGDFLHYTGAPGEADAQSLANAVSEAAGQGADILVYTEEAFPLKDTDRDGFLSFCSELAKENDIAVLLGLDISSSDGGDSSNEAVLIGPDGEIKGIYLKSRLVPIIESEYAPGDGTVPSCTLTLHGKTVTVSWLICYDSNFPSYVRTMDPDTDLLLLPSWDWSAITQLHAKVCRTLAVQNGVYLLKPTYDGLSVACDPSGSVISESSTDTAGYEQVHTVDIPISSSCTTVMPGNTVSPLIHAVIGTEVMAIFICLVLLLSLRLRNAVRTKRSGWFAAIVVSDLAGCCADAASWLLDGAYRLDAFLYISTELSMLVTLFMIGLFCSYLTSYVRERHKISQIPELLGWLFVGLSVILTIVFTFTGDLFVIENGRYEEGPMYILYVLVNALSMLLGLIIVFLYRRSLDREDRIIAYTYMLIPVSMAVVNLFVPDWGFAYPTIAISLVLVYVTLQSDNTERLEQQGRLAGYRATHDDLTGLLNRAALNAKLETLKDSDGSSGIIFCDVNGLKYTNDTLGHEAGDRLLQRFANMLAGIFRAEDLYRLGGDEYICLMADVPEDAFTQHTAELNAALQQYDPPLACIGTVYGPSRDIDSLKARAETCMYAEKETVHAQHPELKR